MADSKIHRLFVIKLMKELKARDDKSDMETKICNIMCAAAENMDAKDIEGIDFDHEAKGASKKYTIQVNAIIREYFKGRGVEEDVNFYKLKMWLARDLSDRIYIPFADCEGFAAVTQDKCKIDPAYVDVFDKYKLMGSDATAEYPFFLIYHEDLDICIKYAVYRAVAGLPPFAMIDFNKKLPTVDHINRVVTDTSNGNLRYCNTMQNCISKVKYHGGGCHTPLEGTKAFAVHLWGNMLDNFVTNADIDTESFMKSWKKKPVILKTGCKYVSNAEELDPWIGIMNQFAIGVLKWLKQEEEQLEFLDKTSTTCEFFVYKSFIGTVQDFFPLDEKVYKSVFKNEFVKALTYDIIKVAEAGEFAHTNFLKVPEPSSTVPVKPMDPVDILNNFEHCYNPEYLRQTYENLFSKKFVGPVTSAYSYCKKRRCIVAKFAEPTGMCQKLTQVPYKVDHLIKSPESFYIVE